MKTLKKVRVGIIGCGTITLGYHLPELKAIPEADVLAVADTREVRAKTTSEKFGIKRWATDYKKMLADDEIDAVVIATYHSTHAPIAIEAIRAGKHVLIQKPMATRMEDADRLVEIVKANPRITVYARPFYHTPAFSIIKRLLDEGAIGKVCMGRARVAHGGPEGYYKDTLSRFGEPDEACWFFNPKAADGGVLLDMGVYALSLMTALLGPVESVFGLARTLHKDVEVEDNALVSLEFASGALGSVETSWTEHGRLDGASLYGVEGTIYLNESQSPPITLSAKRGPYGDLNGIFQPRVPPPKPNASHQHFIDCILKGEKPTADPIHQRHVVEIMLAAYESSRNGRAVEVKSRF
jgi:predicted dehydrogenase